MSNYGFTGEWTDSYIKLIYLRSRYYAPETGRFITKDVWPGDYTRPLSLNGWNYVEGNPVNRTDPTGYKACQEQGGGRYCILNKGGFIDTAHYRGGKRMASDLLNQLKSDGGGWGVNGHPVVAQQHIFPGLPDYTLTYRAYIPKEGLAVRELNRVALGIFMDFQIRYETLQGIDPRCYIEFADAVIPHCSSFSNEDLVSDYLGFLDHINNSINFESIIEVLGGGTSQSDPPTGYYPTNYKFTSFRLLEVDDCGNIQVIRRYNANCVN